jgi:hypothetical protein
LQECWAELAKDARTAHAALRKLALSPKHVPGFIGERLDKERPERERIAKSIADLEAKDFKTRERAAKELIEIGTFAAADWLKLLDQKPSEDARERIEKLKKEFCHPGGAFVTSPMTLRHLRAIEVLERIGTPEAVKVLEQFAKFDARTFEGRDARAALERLAKRAK